MSFLDLFPDSEAAVAGSQGGLDIMRDQNKSALSALELENALLKAVAQKKQFDQQVAQEPLAKTVDAIKLLQGLNVTGASPFQGLDLNDPTAIDAKLKEVAGSGQIISNYEADMQKYQASERARIAATMASQSGQNNRQDDQQRFKEKEAVEKEAEEKVKLVVPKDFRGNIKANLTPAEVEKLKIGYAGLVATHGDTRAVRGLRAMYSQYLAPAQAPKKPETVLDTEARLRGAAPAPATPPPPKDGDIKANKDGVQMIRRGGLWYPLEERKPQSVGRGPQSEGAPAPYVDLPEFSGPPDSPEDLPDFDASTQSGHSGGYNPKGNREVHGRGGKPSPGKAKAFREGDVYVSKDFKTGKDVRYVRTNGQWVKE